jgi:hypothetical protein
MAAVEVTISGVLYDKLMRTTRPVVLIGEASLTGLSVGGGPSPGGPPLGFWGGVAPPYPDQGLPGQPPGIWPSPGHPDQGLPPGGVGVWPGPGYPSHPISPGGGPSQGPGFPTHPIVIPPTEPPPIGEPDEDGFIKPPPASGGWAYHEDYAWLFYPAGQAVPKA